MHPDQIVSIQPSVIPDQPISETTPDEQAPVRGSYSAIFILFDQHDNASQSVVTTETEEQMDEAVRRYGRSFQKMHKLSYEIVLLYKPSRR